MNLKKLFFEGEIMRLMGITMLVKPLALITQVLIARYFGASAMLDAYTFSLFLVTFLGFTLSGVFSSVIIPQITRIRGTKTPTEVQSYQNAVGLLFYLPVLAIVFLFLFKGNLVIDLIGAKLPLETKEYSYKMLRILAAPAFLFCMVKLNSSLLNLNKIFKTPAMMLPLHSVFMLAGIILLHGRLGIWSLPVGWAFSYLIQGIILGIQVLKNKVVTFARPRFSQGELQVLWGLCWTVLIAQGMLMTNTFVDKWFAAGLPVGSISHVNYSMVLIHFGQQIFSLSLIVVMFTKMSEFLAEDRVQECDRYIRHNLVRVSNFVVPISLALFVASPEIVRVLFQRGAFTSYDTAQTSATLSMYLLGLPALVINGIVARIFHSMQKMRERIWLTLQYLVTNVVGNILLVKALATVGLALSSTIAINLHLLISLVWLGYFRTGLHSNLYFRIIGTAYIMGLITYLTYVGLDIGVFLNAWFVGPTIWPALLAGTCKVLVVVAIYSALALAWLALRRKLERD